MQVAFFKGQTRVFNRAVSWWLSGPYSHCELVICTDPQGLSLCISSSYMDGGVRAKWMVLDPEHWDLLDVRASQADALAWFHEHDDCPYDLLGLAGFMWRPITGEKVKWVCSEAVAAMLGIPEPWRFDPMVLWCALTARQLILMDNREGCQA